MRRNKMNKKGEGEETGIEEVGEKSIFFPVAMTVLVFVVLIIFGIFTYYNNSLAQVPPELKGGLIALRFTGNPDCLAYKDGVTGRVFPGMIDMEKFKEEVLSGCYKTGGAEGHESFNFRLVLEKEGKELKTNNYYYKDDFNLFKEVLVKKGEELKKDRLIIYVQEKI